MKHALIYLIPTVCMASTAPHDADNCDSPPRTSLINVPVPNRVFDAELDKQIPQTNSPKPQARKTRE